MKFGGIHLMQLPRPWTGDSERTLLNDALDIVELSDKSGFDYVWATEHHFLEEYSHASAPELFLAAASQRTKNLRLAHGIIQTPPQINHPARVAERIAALDLLSNGRCEFGMGSRRHHNGARRIPRAAGRKESHADRRHAGRRAHAGRGAVYRSPGQVREGPAAQRPAQAAAEAASAAVAGVLAA